MYSLLKFYDTILKTICWNQEEDESESAEAKRTLEKTTRQILKSTFLIRKMKFYVYTSIYIV